MTSYFPAIFVPQEIYSLSTTKGEKREVYMCALFFLVTFHVLVYLRTGLQHAPFLVSDMLADVCMFWFFDVSYCLNEREDDENVRQ